jgi:hypothetical protein
MDEQAEQEVKVKSHYEREARDLTDMLYDKGFLALDLSRESMRKLEDFLAFLFQSKCDSAIRGAMLLKSIRERAPLQGEEKRRDND